MGLVLPSAGHCLVLSLWGIQYFTQMDFEKLCEEIKSFMPNKYYWKIIFFSLFKNKTQGNEDTFNHVYNCTILYRPCYKVKTRMYRANVRN